ncbi:myelin-oligodendrocyte glycoprotein-like [Alligator sinensis]|uniref:Myelin-oligodendrocyte glycoprotein-like n=1 Tax=Alligator sinensis TaxID=38654 RepID=A0A3Q0FNL5_ALLSI|nr:myelin-oligodendrocyte glycoprotein-like [Alligator sinensis]XP_025048867.1 myelin-oligodendrocyte glycoprotein-like [Alligator sinensis]XP_025048868.1 myelin-oligodendrocyte glycoprotein-like [Alligator sinensis]XP_025048869.1 myelin-oligodendrocyte glycoprotein-like [Alligator sinensis]
MKRAGVLHLITCLLLWFVPGVLPQPTLYQAINGDTAILPCANQTSEKLDMKKYSIYWQIESSVVHFFHNGAESLNNQLKRYQNRTRLFLDQLEHGNFSLILSQVQHGDEAVYTCIYRNGETRAIGKHAVRLNVSDIQPKEGNSLYLGQPSHHPNCSSNAKDSDAFVLSLHLLVVIMAWILRL